MIKFMWIFSWLLVIGSPLLAFFKMIPSFMGFKLMLLGSVLGIFIFLVGFYEFAKLRSVHPMTLLKLLSVVPAAFLLGAGFGARNFPRINDISTDLVNIPRFMANSRDMSFPEKNGSLISAHYPQMRNKILKGNRATIWDSVLTVTRMLGMEESLVKDEHDVLHFEGAHSDGIFRFTDDVVIELRTSEHDQEYILAMRSKSRDGQSDFGKNAARIELFFALVDRQLNPVE